jgi:hypothetical protein
MEKEDEEGGCGRKRSQPLRIALAHWQASPLVAKGSKPLSASYNNLMSFFRVGDRRKHVDLLVSKAEKQAELFPEQSYLSRRCGNAPGLRVAEAYVRQVGDGWEKRRNSHFITIARQFPFVRDGRGAR